MVLFWPPPCPLLTGFITGSRDHISVRYRHTSVVVRLRLSHDSFRRSYAAAGTSCFCWGSDVQQATVTASRLFGTSQLLTFIEPDSSARVCLRWDSSSQTEINFDVGCSSWSRTCFSSCCNAVMSDISSGISATLDLLTAQNFGVLPHKPLSSTAESMPRMSSADAFFVVTNSLFSCIEI